MADPDIFAPPKASGRSADIFAAHELVITPKLGMQIVQGAMTGAAVAADFLQRTNYAIAGGTEGFLQGPAAGGPLTPQTRLAEAAKRAGVEMFSGVGGLEGQKKQFGQVYEDLGVPTLGTLTIVPGSSGNVAPGYQGAYDPAEQTGGQFGAAAPGKPRAPVTVTGRGALGLATDIFADPLTYASFGTTGVVKAGGKTVLSRAGEKALAKEIPRAIADVLEHRAGRIGLGEVGKAQRISLEALTKNMPMALSQEQEARLVRDTARDVAIARVKAAAETNPRLLDLGGIKFMGRTIPGTPRIATLASGVSAKAIEVIGKLPYGAAALENTRLVKNAILSRFDTSYGKEPDYIPIRQRFLDGRAAMEARLRSDAASRLAGFKRVTQARTKAIIDTYEAHGLAGLGAEDRALMAPLKDLFDRFGAEEVARGMLDPAILEKNYVPHFYKNPPEEIRDATKYLPGRNRATIGKHAEERAFPTYADAVKYSDGKLQPIYDPVEIVSRRLDAHVNAVSMYDFYKKVGDRFGVIHQFDIHDLIDATAEPWGKASPELVAKESALITARLATSEPEMLTAAREAVAEARSGLKSKARLVAERDLLVKQSTQATADVRFVKADELAYYKRRGYEIVPGGASEPRRVMIQKVSPAAPESKALTRPAALDQGVTANSLHLTQLSMPGGPTDIGYIQFGPERRVSPEQVKAMLDSVLPSGVVVEVTPLRGIFTDPNKFRFDVFEQSSGRMLGGYKKTIEDAFGGPLAGGGSSVFRALTADASKLVEEVVSPPLRLRDARSRLEAKIAEIDADLAAWKDIDDVQAEIASGKYGPAQLKTPVKTFLAGLSDEGKREFLRQKALSLTSDSQLRAFQRAYRDYDQFLPKFKSLEGAPSADGTLYTRLTGIPALKNMDLPKSIADDVADMSDIMLAGNSEDAKGLRKLLAAYDWTNNVMKAAVTVPFPSFYVRNAYSNVLQAAADIGVSALSPKLHAQTFRILRGYEGVFETKFGNYTYHELRGMLDELGVKVQPRAKLEATGALKGRTGRLLEAAGAPYAAIETESRTQLFLNYLRRGASPEDAAARMKLFEIDYNDLTRFQRDYVRRNFLFSTFAYKNTVRQVYNVTHKPGLTAAEIKLFTGRESETGPVTQYGTPDWQFRLNGDGKTVTALRGFDLPVNDLDRIFSDSFIGTVRNDARQIANMLAPIPRTAIEGVTKYNLFTDRPMGVTRQPAAAALARMMPRALQQAVGFEGGFDKVTGKPSAKFDELRFNMLFQSWALSRFIATTDREWKAYEKDPKLFPIIVNLLTGLKIETLKLSDIQARRAAARQADLKAAGKERTIQQFEQQKQTAPERP